VNISKVADKDELVHLAYQYVVPRPQRKYRSNRRGLAMSAKQQKRAAALNRLNFSDASASQTYTMYVYVTIVSTL